MCGVLRKRKEYKMGVGLARLRGNLENELDTRFSEDRWFHLGWPYDLFPRFYNILVEKNVSVRDVVKAKRLGE